MLMIQAPGTATAQEESVERRELERCASLATSIEKLACFESLAESREERRQPEPAAASVSADAAAHAGGATADSSNPVEQPASTRPVDSSTPPDGRSAGERRAVIPAAGTDLGAEHLDREIVEEDRPEMVSARVKEVWKGGNRLLYFQFTNGQVWRQMESGYFFYPREGEFDVTIRQGMMGDYQMRAEGRGRMTRIVRVK